MFQELSAEEIKFVSGADPIGDFATTTGAGGSAIGIIATGTAEGAAEGGAVGAALGFAFGVGFAAGTWLYNTFA